MICPAAVPGKGVRSDDEPFWRYLRSVPEAELTTHLPAVIACSEILSWPATRAFQPQPGSLLFAAGQMTLAFDDEQNLVGIVIAHMPLGLLEHYCPSVSFLSVSGKLPALAKLPPAILNVFFIIRRRST
jgi:hypothetical protein